MKRRLLPACFILCVLAPTMLSGCMLFHRKPPPEPCSQPWMDAQLDDIFDDFRDSVGDELQEFRIVAKSINDKKKMSNPLMVFRVMSLKKDIETIVVTYRDSVSPRIASIAQQCDAPYALENSLLDFLREEGATPETLDMVRPFLPLLRDALPSPPPEEAA